MRGRLLMWRAESGGHHLQRMEMRAIVLLKKAENK